MSPPRVHFKHFGIRIRTLYVERPTKDIIWLDPYRWELKIGRLAIYKYYRGDSDPDAHDHPANFHTFPLVGYVENVFDPVRNAWALRVVEAWKLHYRRATFCHRVEGRWTGLRHDAHSREPALRLRPIAQSTTGTFWTIVWWGTEFREWGFYRRGLWIPWQEYINGTGKTWAD